MTSTGAVGVRPPSSVARSPGYWRTTMGAWAVPLMVLDQMKLSPLASGGADRR